MRPPPARLAAALALLVCALPAAAQTSPDSVAWQRFWPHAIGDTWEYYYYRVCYSSGCSSSPLPYGEVRQVVVGDTLIEGAVFAVYEIESGSGGAFYESGRCAAGILPGDVWFTTRPVPGFTNKCPFAGIADPVIAGSFYALAQDRPVAPRAVEVGGQTYTVDATVGVGYPWSGATYPAYLFAADVGVYARSWQSGSGSHYERHMWQLQYARVGGVEYGTPMPPTTLSVQVETPVVYVADPVAHLALTVTGIYPLRPRVDFHRLTGGIAEVEGGFKLLVGVILVLQRALVPGDRKSVV